MKLAIEILSRRVLLPISYLLLNWGCLRVAIWLALDTGMRFMDVIYGCLSLCRRFEVMLTLSHLYLLNKRLILSKVSLVGKQIRTPFLLSMFVD